MVDTQLMIRIDDSAAAGKTLPSNIEAEAAFLGAALIDNRVLEELRTPIRPEHFFEPLHQRIFDRILKLVDRNATASPVTLKPYFESDEALGALGGTTYLAQLTADGQGLLAPRNRRIRSFHQTNHKRRASHH